MAMKTDMLLREVEIEREKETEIAGKRWRYRDKKILVYSKIKYRFYCVEILAHCVNRRWGLIILRILLSSSPCIPF